MSTQNQIHSKMSTPTPRKITDKGPDGKPTLSSIKAAANLMDEETKKRKRMSIRELLNEEAEMSGDGHSEEDDDMQEGESDREFIADDDEDIRPELPDRLEQFDGLLNSDEEEELAAEVKENVVNAMMHVMDRWRMPYTTEGGKRGALIANMILSKYEPKVWDFEAAYLGMMIGDGWEAVSDAPRHIRFEERERAKDRKHARAVQIVHGSGRMGAVDELKGPPCHSQSCNVESCTASTSDPTTDELRLGGGIYTGRGNRRGMPGGTTTTEPTNHYSSGAAAAIHPRSCRCTICEEGL